MTQEAIFAFAELLNTAPGGIKVKGPPGGEWARRLLFYIKCINLLVRKKIMWLAEVENKFNSISSCFPPFYWR